MIQGLPIKWLFKSIYRAIERKHNLKKIDKYVNKPNELDKQMKQVQKNLTKALKNQEEIEKDIGILKTDSHPRSDWICLECGCKAKKKKKKSSKKRDK
mgnify:CR=1 FL=1